MKQMFCVAVFALLFGPQSCGVHREKNQALQTSSPLVLIPTNNCPTVIIGQAYSCIYATLSGGTPPYFVNRCDGMPPGFSCSLVNGNQLLIFGTATGNPTPSPQNVNIQVAQK